MNSALKARKSEQGFTLVELAIVMIIIGLLIAGILKGQELIANAQVTSTIAQTKGIDAALGTFRDTYGTLPGDLANAQQRLPNCTAACNGPAAALGNGRVDSDVGAAVAVASEGGVAFRQLAAGNLLSGVNIVSTTAAVDAGDEVPSASISGASVRVGQARAAAPTGNQGGVIATWSAGEYLAVGGDPAQAVGAAGADALSPSQALRIDEKLDDGLPQSGSVRAGGLATCVAAIGGTNSYDTSLATQVCASFVRVQG
jgi:prepilin-type N-terminal cleavage/methylation domain-containing protein